MNRVSVDRLDICAKAGGLRSQSNPRRDLRPAFLDIRTGRIELARFANGAPAPCHLTDGLPEEWLNGGRRAGGPAAVEPFVIPGFVHEGRFLTRREAAHFVTASS